MTTLNLDDNQAQYQIHAYRPGHIKINDESYTQSVIISPNQLITDWQPQTINELSKQSFDIILTLKPSVLLIGTGNEHIFLAPEIYGDLMNHGIGVEIMSTGAACRTYNALSSENRNVAAALIIR